MEKEALEKEDQLLKETFAPKEQMFPLRVDTYQEGSKNEKKADLLPFNCPQTQTHTKKHAHIHAQRRKERERRRRRKRERERR